MLCGPCNSSLWLPLATILKTLKWRSAFKENAKAKHFQGKKQKRFSSFLQNLSGASSLCVSDEVFWTEDLIEETTKRLHDSYTIVTLIEHDMSAQLNSSLPSLRPVLHAHAGFRNEDGVNESAPYPELQEGSTLTSTQWRSSLRVHLVLLLVLACLD